MSGDERLPATKREGLCSECGVSYRRRLCRGCKADSLQFLGTARWRATDTRSENRNHQRKNLGTARDWRTAKCVDVAKVRQAAIRDHATMGSKSLLQARLNSTSLGNAVARTIVRVCPYCSEDVEESQDFGTEATSGRVQKVLAMSVHLCSNRLDDRY